MLLSSGLSSKRGKNAPSSALRPALNLDCNRNVVFKKLSSRCDEIQVFYECSMGDGYGARDDTPSTSCATTNVLDSLQRLTTFLQSMHMDTKPCNALSGAASSVVRHLKHDSGE